jgi:hypothetical protein
VQTSGHVVIRVYRFVARDDTGRSLTIDVLAPLSAALGANTLPWSAIGKHTAVASNEKT